MKETTVTEINNIDVEVLKKTTGLTEKQLKNECTYFRKLQCYSCPHQYFCPVINSNRKKERKKNN